MTRRQPTTIRDVLPESLVQDLQVAVGYWITDPVHRDPPRVDDEFLGAAAERSLGAFVTRGFLRDALFNARPEFRERYEQMRNALARLRIAHPYRFSTEGLSEIIENRINRRQPEDHRPTAVLVYSRVDHNGALAMHELDQLRKTHRVLYYEAATDTELASVLREARAHDGRASLIVLSGHGSSQFMSVGGVDPRTDGVTASQREALYLDASDQKELASLSQLAEAGADVVLISCLVGQGRGREMNVANAVAQGVPQARVWSSEEETNVRFIVDAKEKKVVPQFLSGSATTYVIEPRSL